MKRLARVFAVLVAAAVVLSGAATQAQDAASAALTSANVGVVDIARVGQEYAALLEQNTALQKLADSATAEFQARSSYLLLTEEEMQQLLAVLATEKPSEEQQAQVKKLTDEAGKREAELLALDTKAEPTDADKNRRSELRGIRQAATEKLDQVRTAYSAQLELQRQKIEGEVVDAVRKAIGEVAAEKALPMVFDKDAILFGGTDITDLVLAKLNAGAPAAAGPATTPEGGAEGGGTPGAAPATP